MTDTPAHPHACDAPGIQPREFLYAIMRDHTLPITTRIDAADRLLRIYGEPEPIAYTVVIGGIPPEPVFDPSDMCSDISDCLRRTTKCYWQKLHPHLASCKTKILQEQLAHITPEGTA